MLQLMAYFSQLLVKMLVLNLGVYDSDDVFVGSLGTILAKRYVYVDE